MNKSKCIAAAALLALVACQTADVAAVTAPSPTTCNRVLMYGNAVMSGLCRSLSPAGQNLWVCELSSSPDIHTTVNDEVQLHLTAANGACRQSSYLTGMWPTLARAAGQPPTVCGVIVDTYVGRLNAVPTTYGTVQAAFTAAQAARRLNPSVANSYMALGC
jgi:hypothetical protein